MKLSDIFDILSRKTARLEEQARREEQAKRAERRHIMDAADKLMSQHMLLDPEVRAAKEAYDEWCSNTYGCGLYAEKGGKYGELRSLGRFDEMDTLDKEEKKLSEVYEAACVAWHEKFDIPRRPRMGYIIDDDRIIIQLARDYIARYSPPNPPPQPSTKNSLPNDLMPSLTELVAAAQSRIARNSTVIVGIRGKQQTGDIAAVREDQRQTLQILEKLTVGNPAQLIEQVRRELARYFHGKAGKPTTWLADLPARYWQKFGEAQRPRRSARASRPNAPDR